MAIDPRKALIDIEAERGRRSLSWFIQRGFSQVETVQYSHNWHIDCIAEHLQAITRGEIRKLIINVPPASMKSLSVCVFWSAWMWIQDPDIKQLFTSFDSKLTLRDGRRVQQLLNSDWFRARWGERVRVNPNEPGGDFKAYHGNGREGGWRFATSIDGKTTGMHPGVKVIDDPTKPREATKENLEKAWEWYQNTFTSRGDQRTVSTVCIMQRLAEGDLAQRLLESDKDFVHVCIPLEYESKRSFSTPYYRDPRTEEGESFWLERFPPSVIRSIKAVITDTYVYSAQYQQDPTPGSGLIFAQEWIDANRWIELPSLGTWLQSWDCTFKGEATSDFVVGQLWFKPERAEFYLVDQVREKMDFNATAAKILDLSKAPRWKFATAKLIEDKANGSAILSHLKSKVSGMQPVKVDGNAGKVARARAVSPYWKAKNVWLPAEAEWLFEFKAELTKFPKAKHDDQVDAMTQALNYWTEETPFDYATAMENAKKMGLY